MSECITVVGLGYIGLPTAALLASRGVQVRGVDVAPHVVETISKGRVHIVEPDLDGLVQKAVSSGNLVASSTMMGADVFIIAVPTPLSEDHRPDTAFVEAAACNVATVLEPGNLIVLESTVPVGTTERIAGLLRELRPDLRFPGGDDVAPDVHLAYCPERVLPGRVLSELIHNDRCIGGMTAACAKRASEVYRIFLEAECFETNARTAEMVKLTENAYRDVNIAFANELSMICDGHDIDVWEMIELANRHPRVDILQPGPGVGGHCIAIDPWFIVHSAPERAKLIKTAREINESRPLYVLDKVGRALNGNGASTIACLGLAFKPNVDDLRNSPALGIVEALGREHGAKVVAVEPYIETPPRCLSQHGVRLTDAKTAIAQSDIVLLLVDHRQFLGIDLGDFADKTVIDTRGLWRDARDYAKV